MIWLFGFLLPFLNSTSGILLLAFVAYITYYYRRLKGQQNVWEKKGIKYVEADSLTGNQKPRKAYVEDQQDLYNQFPEERYHGVYQNFRPILLIKDPDLIKTITVKEFDHFMDHHASMSADSDPLWSKNMFASRGERWRDLRSTLSPSFTSSKMKFMYNLMEECALQFVDFFKRDPSELIELEMRDTFTRLTNDVIASAAFGISCNSLKDRNNEFFKMGTEATGFKRGGKLENLIRHLSPRLAKLLKMTLIPPHVADYFSKIIENTVRTREERNIVRPDMIHLMMEAKRGREQKEEEALSVSEGFSSVEESEIHKIRRKREITIDDIAAQAFIFFFAGFQTVSILFSFTSYELALNPDIQARLRKEIEDLKELTYESVLSLKYLDMVISESLRKWPAGILVEREVTKPFTIRPVRPGEKPLHLEKGLSCWMPIFAIHRDPKFHPDPDKFDPERFSDENKHKIHPSTYIPFGAGPRNCIGSRFALLESKLMLVHLLKNFEIVPVAKTPIPMVLDKYQFNLTAEGGMWLGFKKIK